MLSEGSGVRLSGFKLKPHHLEFVTIDELATAILFSYL